MNPGPNEVARTTTEEARYVSARFLTDFFSALSRRGINAVDLVGDLPISLDGQGRVARVVEWPHFVDFLRRLEHHVEGTEGLEKLGELICEMKPARPLQSLAGFTASPFSLYRAASGWVLRRALPGIESKIERVGENHIVIRARVADPLRSCPQLFHIAAGGARALPRILGMPDAVISPEIGEREAVFQIIVPPSRTISARIRRFLQMLFSADSVLRFLEDQQLELHAKHDALVRANAELEKNEQRYRQMTDAAVDVLCEIDEDGQVSYVSAAVSELLGYTPDQVTGSHFRLWIPTEYHAVVTERFERLFTESAGQSSIRERLTLHAAGGRRVPVELMARTYCLSDRASEDDQIAAPPEHGTRPRVHGWQGARRFVATIRALREPCSVSNPSPPPAPIHDDINALNSFDALDALHSTSTEPEISTPPPHLIRAVEQALLASADGRNASDWMDTRKLIDRAQFALQNQHTFALRIDTRNAPAQIAGDEELLAACLRGLLGWGVARLAAKPTPHAFARSTPPQKLVLRIEAAVETETEVRLSVGIDWPRAGSNEGIYAKKPQLNIDQSSSPLTTCLIEAKGAALALGGQLVTGSNTHPPERSHHGDAAAHLDTALNPHAMEQSVRLPQPIRRAARP